MSSQKIARRYASALFEQVKADSKQQKDLDGQLAAVAELFENKEIKKVIASPVVSESVLNAVFDNVAQQINAGESLKQFFRVLISSRRAGILPDIHKAFHRLYLETQSSVEAKVVSAVTLDASEIDQIKSRLEEMLSKKVLLETEIDKSILGGFVIKIDNNLIDMSLKTKLDNMTKFAVS